MMVLLSILSLQKIAEENTAELYLELPKK